MFNVNDDDLNQLKIKINKRNSKILSYREEKLKLEDDFKIISLSLKSNHFLKTCNLVPGFYVSADIELPAVKIWDHDDQTLSVYYNDNIYRLDPYQFIPLK